MVSALHVKNIPALAMQLPADKITFPRIYPVSAACIKKLVDFHQQKYVWSPQMGVIVREVFTADILCDDKFVNYIARELKVPVSILDSSNYSTTVKAIIRDRLKLKMVVELHYSAHNVCLSCRFGFSESDITAVVSCCNHTFHKSCIIYLKQCPYCKEPWLPLPCVVCKRSILPKINSSFYEKVKVQVSNRMSCCDTDCHASCHRKIVLVAMLLWIT